MQDSSTPYPFETVVLQNRLDMDIEVDLIHITIKDRKTIVIRANKNYHSSTIAKNIEHIAFQLKSQFNENGHPFSLIEYRQKSGEEWWQWRFNWVGNTPLESESYRLSASTAQAIIKQLSEKRSPGELMPA